MPDYQLSEIDVCLSEPSATIRAQLREALIRFGLRRTRDYPNLAETRTALESTAVDLLLIDGDQGEGEVFRIIHSIRHGHLGENPYMGIIVTTWQPTGQLLARTTNSGADDLLVKPVSPKQIQDRLAALIEARKPFVVTSDFIGPDRRKAPREGQQIGQFTVPNILRMKAMGVYGRGSAAEEIAEANAALNAEKLLRHAFQIAFLVEFALPGLQRPEPDRFSLDSLGRIPGVVEDFVRRLPHDAANGDVAVEAKRIASQVERVRQALGRDEAAALLGDLKAQAYGLMRSLSPERLLDEMAAEVSGAVAKYRERLAEMAAARAAQAAAQAAAEAAQSD
ncbi:MAG TPA: response regulator [Alphaproteobacteria bacterium]|nr:response regulator [Alphaproteobacteria bacterium]